MKWFRWYAGTSEDIKLHAIARNALVTAATVTGVWAALLEDASHDDHPGISTRSIELLSAITMLAESELQTILKGMEKFGLIEIREEIHVLNWDRRQFRSDQDPTANERQARYRALRNGRVTRTETESDTEQKEISIEDEFAVWYAAYPRKHGRGQAIKAYRQARKKADATALLAGIERYKKLKPTYADWAMPASWLRAERWLDEADSSGNGTAPALTGDDLWRWKLKSLTARKYWSAEWGPRPGNGCSAPASILQEFGLSA